MAGVPSCWSIMIHGDLHRGMPNALLVTLSPWCPLQVHFVKLRFSHKGHQGLALCEAFEAAFAAFTWSESHQDGTAFANAHLVSSQHGSECLIGVWDRVGQIPPAFCMSLSRVRLVMRAKLGLECVLGNASNRKCLVSTRKTTAKLHGAQCAFEALQVLPMPWLELALLRWL